jgi:hypothetical protein
LREAEEYILEDFVGVIRVLGENSLYSLICLVREISLCMTSSPSKAKRPTVSQIHILAGKKVNSFRTLMFNRT